MVRIRVGETAYIRVVNQAYQFARFSLGGESFQIVATDGRPLETPITTDNWEMGTGERYDILYQPTKPFFGLATIDYLNDYTGQVLGQASTRIIVTPPFLGKRRK